METEFEKTLEELKKLKNETYKKIRQDDGILKYPSPSILEQYSLSIIKVLNNCKIETDEFKNWISWKKRKLNIFNADIVGELYHDFDKRLVRYQGKWYKQREIPDCIISEFEQCIWQTNY